MSTLQTSVVPGSPSLAASLRDRTRDAHTRAETHPVQKRLAKGELSREEFIGLTRAMGQVHAALRPAVDAVRAHATAGTLASDMADMASVFESDLKALGATGAGSEPASISRLAAWVLGLAERGDIAALVGVVYVVEGSTNGGFFLAPIVERSLGLARGAGTAWLNPYGDGVRTRWQSYRARMDAMGFSEAQCVDAVAAANTMFDAISAVMDDLVRGGVSVRV